MFYGRMKVYDVYAPTYSSDRLNQKVKSYRKEGSVRAYIVAQDRTTYAANEILGLRATYVAYLDPFTSSSIGEGYKIGNYEIISRIDQLCYLKELENGIK